MKVKSESEVAQLCLTPSDPMDCSLPGSSVHGIFQARVLEWGAIVNQLHPNKNLKKQMMNPVGDEAEDIDSSEITNVLKGVQVLFCRQ